MSSRWRRSGTSAARNAALSQKVQSATDRPGGLDCSATRFDGRIPDVGEAVDSPRRLTSDPACARRILGLVPQVPTAVWGRDDLKTGDMWNSNSLISWLIAHSGIETTSIYPPARGRAPGWQAGLVLAARQINAAAAETQTNAHLVHV